MPSIAPHPSSRKLENRPLLCYLNCICLLLLVMIQGFRGSAILVEKPNQASCQICPCPEESRAAWAESQSHEASKWENAQPFGWLLLTACAIFASFLPNIKSHQFVRDACLMTSCFFLLLLELHNKAQRVPVRPLPAEPLASC